MDLTLAEFATRSGTDVATIERMQQLDILPEGSSIDLGLVPRALLGLEIQRSGIPLEDLMEALNRHDISLAFVDRNFLQGDGLRAESYREHAAAIGMSDSVFDSMRIALGVADSGLDTQIPDLDARLMDRMQDVLSLGLDERLAGRLFQMMADLSRRTVRAVNEMWSDGIQQPLLDEGHTHLDMFRIQSTDASAYADLGEQLVVLLWKRFLDEQIYLGTAATLELALAEAGVVPKVAARPPAIVFLDLTAFTHVTDRDGDEMALSGATALTRVVRRVAVASGGTMVKMLGDGAMLHYVDPAAAIRGCVALREAIAEEGLPSSRFGVNAGPLMVRDVDYYGNTVNVAARLLDYARPGEILITNQVVEAVDADGFELTHVGGVSLKGVSGLVDVWTAELA